MRRPTTPLPAVLSLAAFAGLLFASAFAGFMAASEDWVADGRTVGERGEASRFAHRITIYGVDPGDTVEFGTSWGSGADPAGPHLRVLAVEGGEGQAYLEGGSAQHVILETSYPRHDPSRWGGPARAARAHDPLEARFVRPDVPAGKPHAQGLNGDLHDAVDLVWVYDRPAGMDDRTWDATRTALVTILREARHSVADGAWLGVQPILLAGALGAGAAAVAATLLWLRRPQRAAEAAPPPGEGPGIEGLVVLQAQARAFLGSLRNTMRAAGAMLLFGGVSFLVTLGQVAEHAEVKPWPWWEGALVAAGLAGLVAAMVVWAAQHRRIVRELRRWDANPPPL